MAPTQSANVDVRSLSANNRGMLYAIGYQASIGKKDLVRGKCFVPTADTTAVQKELVHLFSFLHCSGWPKMQQHVQQIQQIYCSAPAMDTMVESERDADIASRIVDTRIIPGLLVTVLLDAASVPNGPNIISDYLAARAIDVGASNAIKMKYANL